MNIEDLTNGESTHSPDRGVGAGIDVIGSSDNDVRSTSPSTPVAKRAPKKLRRRLKPGLYDYRVDPRYKGQKLVFDIPLQPEGIVVNFQQLVKDYLDAEEIRKRELGELSEEGGFASEAMEASQSQGSGSVGEVDDALMPIPGEEAIEDEFLLGLLKKARSGVYEPERHSSFIELTFENIGLSWDLDSDESVGDPGDYDYSDDFIDDSELLHAPQRSATKKPKPKQRAKGSVTKPTDNEGETSFDEFGKDPRGISKFYVHHGPLAEIQVSRPKPKPVLKQPVTTKQHKASNAELPSSAVRLTTDSGLTPSMPPKNISSTQPIAQPNPTNQVNSLSSTSDDSELSSDTRPNPSSTAKPHTPYPKSHTPTHHPPRPQVATQLSRLESPSNPTERSLSKASTVSKHFTTKLPPINPRPPKTTPVASADKRLAPPGAIPSSASLSPAPPSLTNAKASQNTRVGPKQRKILQPNPKPVPIQKGEPWYRSLPSHLGLKVEFTPRLEALFQYLKNAIEGMPKPGPIPVNVKSITLDLIRIHLRYDLTASGSPPVGFIHRLTFLFKEDAAYINKLITKMFLSDQLAQRIKEKLETLEHFRKFVSAHAKSALPDPTFKWTSEARELVCRLYQLNSAIYQLNAQKLTSEGKQDEIPDEKGFRDGLYEELNQFFPPILPNEALPPKPVVRVKPVAPSLPLPDSLKPDASPATHSGPAANPTASPNYGPFTRHLLVQPPI
ncbi:hypothetical protein L0F63_000256 [Massospora cicadina]|nr:hypothetical protein L0F63_000256 [Massospora cicadina]